MPNTRVRLLFSNAPYKIGDRTAISLYKLHGTMRYAGANASYEIDDLTKKLKKV
jgi:hypothetical protein